MPKYHNTETIFPTPPFMLHFLILHCIVVSFLSLGLPFVNLGRSGKTVITVNCPRCILSSVQCAECVLEGAVAVAVAVCVRGGAVCSVQSVLEEVQCAVCDRRCRVQSV